MDTEFVSKMHEVVEGWSARITEACSGWGPMAPNESRGQHTNR
jgi:hypothetical protein